MNKTDFFEYQLYFPQSQEDKENLVYDDFRLSNATHLTFSTQFTPYVSEKITLYQDFYLNKGGIFWDCSYLLIKYFLDQYTAKSAKEEIEQQNVLELGSGTGLPSIVAGKSGYFTVLTDLQYLLTFVEKNVKLNFTADEVGKKIIVDELNWGQLEQMKKIKNMFKNGKIDFIFASELIYLEDTIIELVLTLKYLCNINTRVMFAYRIRLEWKIDIFWKLMKQIGFEYEFVDKSLTKTIHPNEKLLLVIVKLATNSQEQINEENFSKQQEELAEIYKQFRQEKSL